MALRPSARAFTPSCLSAWLLNRIRHQTTVMKKQWKWAIGIAAFCILTPIISTITSLGIRSHAINSGAAIVAEFLGDLRSHDYTKAHALMAPSEQAAVSVTALQKAQEQIEKKHGRWLSAATGDEYHPNSALNQITYFYDARVEKDEDMWLMVQVVRTNGGWRVSEYHYDYSPA